MKLAIISDIHLGDPNCTLCVKTDEEIILGDKYAEFADAVGKENDYLILLGDIFDFSIRSYQEVYKIAKVFFQQVKTDELAKEIIYVPGNHDADFWHIVEHEVNIINRIKEGKNPRAFKMSLPGIIDDRSDSPTKGFTLPGVTVQEQANHDAPKYAGLFLDKITSPTTYFNFAYPNLYMVTDEESVLLTHGQYLESYWCLAGEIALQIAKEDLELSNAISLKDVIGLNFPLNQLACTGIGQADPLTKLIRKVQREIKDKELSRVKTYLNRLEKLIDDKTNLFFIKDMIVDKCVSAVKKETTKALENRDNTLYNEAFINKEEVQERFKKFYYASFEEINGYNKKYRYSIPIPTRIIFGHTHVPVPWGAEKAPTTSIISHTVTLYNTGGWLYKKNGQNEKQFCGAEIFKYETGAGFSSVSLR